MGILLILLIYTKKYISSISVTFTDILNLVESYYHPTPAHTHTTVTSGTRILPSYPTSLHSLIVTILTIGMSEAINAQQQGSLMHHASLPFHKTIINLITPSPSLFTPHIPTHTRGNHQGTGRIVFRHVTLVLLLCAVNGVHHNVGTLHALIFPCVIALM